MVLAVFRTFASALAVSSPACCQALILSMVYFFVSSCASSVTINDSFRKYNTWGESIDDHSKLLSQGSRYAPAMKVRNDADAFARAIHKAGYATSPTYSSTLISIMKQYNLYQWDR